MAPDARATRPPPLGEHWPARENRQLGVECPLERGPRLAAAHVGGKVRVLVQHSGAFQPFEDRHHQEIACAELAVEPVGIAEARGQVVQPHANAILQEGQALLVPGSVMLEESADFALDDRKR